MESSRGKAGQLGDVASLSERRILITGAGSGIGNAIARACLARGAVVGGNFLSASKGISQLASEFPDRVISLPFDVRDAQAVAAGVSRFAGQLGGIDGVVNNAGIISPALVMKADLDEMRNELEVNFLGAVYTVHHALKFLVKSRSSAIVSISSAAVQRPMPGQATYAASKAALETFTTAVAVEYAKYGLRANTLRLGPVESPMLDKVRRRDDALKARVLNGRYASREEVAVLVAFLLSDAAGFITGTVQTFDGGYALF